MVDEIRYIKNIPGGRGDLPFSRAVVANGFVWVSGVGGANQASGEGGGTIEEQTRGTIENLRKDSRSSRIVVRARRLDSGRVGRSIGVRADER